MKNKLVAALATVVISISIAGTATPITAAEPAERSVWQKLDFEIGKSMKLTSTQKKMLQKKALKANLYTRFICDIIWSENLTKAEIRKAKAVGSSVCKFSKSQTKNLALGESIYEADEDLKGKKFRIWVGFTEPRQVTFQEWGAFTGTFPSDSKFLKYNATFTMPNPGDLEPSGGEFTGWSTEPYGEGRFFAASSKVKIKKPLYLYPVWVGYSIDINIGTLDTSVGNQIGVAHKVPGDVSKVSKLSQTGSINATKAAGNTIQLRVPGDADESSFTSSNGVTRTNIGWGTCPDLGFVEDKCTIATFSYTGAGSISFSHVNQN